MKYFTEADIGKNINKYLYSRFGRTAMPAFSRPTRDCLYIKLLRHLRRLDECDFLLKESRRRKTIQHRFGLPAHYDNCVWTGLMNVGLIRKERVGNTFDYYITEKGKEYLELYGF